MALALDSHPHARSVLVPALANGRPSHAYLFHGPGGSGKREFARLFAADLLAEGSPDPASARARAIAGSHPDLTWVSPSGAHEILVSDVDAAVVAAATRTPFESARRVFVIESVDLLGDGAANRMLKTLEEPAHYVHLVLITDRLADVLETIRSRCQLVRFDGPSLADLTRELTESGIRAQTAEALARLSLGDAGVARELARPEGAALRTAAEQYSVAVLSGRAAQDAPWRGLLGAVKARGEAVVSELETQASAELEMVPRKERTRVQREWDERAKRVRRRVETAALGLALTLIEAWLLDQAALGWGVPEQVRNCDRLGAAAGLSRPPGVPVTADGAAAGLLRPAASEGAPADALVRAVALVEATRLNLPLNVNEELALEALAYRIEGALGR